MRRHLCLVGETVDPREDIPPPDDRDAPPDDRDVTPENKDKPTPEDYRVDHLWSGFADDLTQQVGSGKVPSGLDEFDRLLGGGLPSGQVSLLIGGPGIGKTSLALSFAAQYAKKGGQVVFWSLELPTALALARLVCQERDVPWSEVLAGNCSKEVDDAGTVFAGLPLYLTEDRDEAVIESLLSPQDRPPLIVVDYAQLLASDGFKDQRRAVEEASGWLVALAKRSGAAVLAISSTSRAYYNIGKTSKVNLDKVMTMGRETGRLEFDAAVVVGFIALGQEGEDDDSLRFRRGCLAVAKNRLGQRGIVAVEMNGLAGTVREVDPSEITPAEQSLSNAEIDAEILQLALTQKLTTRAQYRKKIKAQAQRVVDGIKRLIDNGRLVDRGRGKPFGVVEEGVQ